VPTGAIAIGYENELLAAVETGLPRVTDVTISLGVAGVFGCLGRSAADYAEN
jgi:hypothetical protein